MAKKPEAYVPPDYGVRSLAIERRMAGQPPASETEAETKAEKAPLNKMDLAPDNKAEALSSMTKAELVDVAKAEGVEIETDDNKADLVRKIEKARKG